MPREAQVRIGHGGEEGHAAAVTPATCECSAEEATAFGQRMNMPCMCRTLPLALRASVARTIANAALPLREGKIVRLVLGATLMARALALLVAQAVAATPRTRPPLRTSALPQRPNCRSRSRRRRSGPQRARHWPALTARVKRCVHGSMRLRPRERRRSHASRRRPPASPTPRRFRVGVSTLADREPVPCPIGATTSLPWPLEELVVPVSIGTARRRVEPLPSSPGRGSARSLSRLD